MKTRIDAFIIVAVLAALVEIAASPLAGGAQSTNAAPSRAPRNAEEFDALFQHVKNWGR
jgi:hypothetical protein